ncbi:putative Kinesin [Leptomonas seymouri]|uniref:Putative Kinesin n=1 Tax=Leptomonas seymouri TaxID=5684 RepID=A0A0N1IMQ7_LEPSE|nr:putative Kinesin [Leptomonas seymouri]|eukprot:KPI90442.1 putative Kinesin [Leptomonas seymouri]
MQRNDDNAHLLLLETPPKTLPHERQVVWKHQPNETSHSQAVMPSSTYIDPIATTQNGKSFFGRIRVIVRCRPLQRATESDHTDNRVHTHGDEVIVCEKNNSSTARSYRFDRVLPPDADQVTTFAEVAPLVDHVLDGFHATVFAYGQTGSGKSFTMDGLRYVASVCCRPKGNTAAMVPDPTGTPVEEHGIMPRMIQLIFDRARARQRARGDEGEGALVDSEGAADPTADDGVEYTFRCSYYQIYNEMITDLLRTTGSSPDPNGNDGSPDESGRVGGGAKGKRRFDDGGLRVRWQKGDVFKVENLYVYSCASPEEMREMLFAGTQQKVVSSHLMNYHSSRSHSVFTIYVECRARKNGELRSRSELSLVDLAGSEKIGLLSRNPSAKLVKESIDINTSLLALGKVIMALSSSSGGTGAQSKKKAAGASSLGRSRLGGRGHAAFSGSTAHIPYRDSKLTMLLKHALGGNSLTTMIACISPSDRYVEETTSTLLYAGRAKNIRNAPRINEDATTTLIRQLREEIAQLKAELGYYREMAAKPLGQPPGVQANLCTRCGGDLQGGAANPEGSLSTNKRSMELAVTTLETEQLADSLIAACDMLKNMMGVNAELRDAYDAVRDAQDDADRREAHLNAENLALRERLAVLESIVLQDNDELDDGEATAEVSEGTALPEPSAKTAARKALESGKRTAEASAALVANAAGGDQGKGSPTSSPSPSSGYPTRQALSSPLLAGAHTSKIPTHPKANVEAPPLLPLGPTKVLPTGSYSSKEVLPHALPERREVPHASNLVTPASPTRRARTSSRSLDSPRQLKYDGSQAGSKGQRSKRNSHITKLRVLAQRLKEYEQHYRTPSRTETYEDYYKQPRRGRAATADSVPDELPIRSVVSETSQTTATLEDTKLMVAKLPKNIVSEYVPSSLLRPGLFGSLAFGGRKEEQREFEQHRSDRAARLRALQQQQKDLYKQVHQAVRDVSLWKELQGGEASSPSPPPQLPEGDNDTPASTSINCKDSINKVNSKGNSNGALVDRRPPSENPGSRVTATVRSSTAVYNDARGRKKNVRGPVRSTESLTKLMEYLDKEEP